MTTALRPLTLGELLDRTFLLYRQHFVVFVGIAALPHLALLTFQLLSTADQYGGAFNFTTLLWLLGAMLLTLVVATVVQAATVIAVSQIHLGRPIAIGDAFAAVRGRIVPLCVMMVGMGILVGLGLLLFVVPGILLALRWALLVPTAVLERATFWQATSRSTELTSGIRGRVFMIYFLYIVATMIVTSIWQVPVLIATISAAVAKTTPPMWTQIVAQVGAFVTQSLAGPLLTIAISLVYYDQRVRKEAFDLEHMLAQLDTIHGESTAPA